MAGACDDPQLQLHMGDLQHLRQKVDNDMEEIRDDTTHFQDDVDILLSDLSALVRQFQGDILPRIADIEKGIVDMKR
eukprot:4991603-Pyramimonas_sp.AAC.1